MRFKQDVTYLVRVGETTHTAHDPQHVVVGGVHSDVGHTASPHGVRGHNHLDRGVVDPREVTGARRLVLLRTEGERVHVNTSGRGSSVVLERLNQVEVRTEALREAVLAVEEELGTHNWVVTPAVLRPRALSDDRGDGTGWTAVEGRAVANTATVAASTTLTSVGRIGPLFGVGTLVHTGCIKEIFRKIFWSHINLRARGGGLAFTPSSRPGERGTPCLECGRCTAVRAHAGSILLVDLEFKTVSVILAEVKAVVQGRPREAIKLIGVVERLGTIHHVLLLEWLELSTVVHIARWLDNPDKLLAWVVEVELDLVRRTADRLIAGELKLLNQVLVRVLSHSSPFIRVQEHVVDVERSTYEAGVRVDTLGLLKVARPICYGRTVRGGSHSPQHVLEVVHLEDDLDLVVLEGNERDRETRVLAVPELQRNVECRGRESITVDAARSAHVGSSITDCFSLLATAGSEVGEFSGITDHLVVPFLLAGSDSQLVPDVHPVTILAIDPLTTDLNLDTADDLLARVVEPPSKACVWSTCRLRTFRGRCGLDLRESHLKVGPVGEIAIPANSASDPATEVGLAVESLFDRLCSEVGVSSVCNFPESDLRVASKVNVLSAVCDKLHQSASHSILLLKKRFRRFAPKERYRLHFIRDSCMFLDKCIKKVLGKHLLLTLM